MTNPVTEKAAKVLPVAAAISFLGFLDTHLLIPIIALYASSLGAGVGAVGIVVGLYSLSNTPANIFFGRLIDRRGYKITLVTGLLGDAASMFLYSLCRLPVHLALVRLLHGTAGGMVGPATMSLIADASPEAQKGRGMAFYGIALAAATLVGYGPSGFIASRFHYNAVFFLGAGMLLLGTILSLTLPQGRNRHASPDTFPGGWSKARGLLVRRGLVVAYAAIFAQYFTFGGMVTLLPLHVKALGMGAVHVGMLLALFAVAFIALQFPVGIMSDRLGRLRPTVAGVGLSILALLIIASVDAFPLLVPAMLLYGAAYGMLFPAISAMVADNSAAGERGMATGIFHAMLTTGVGIGAPVMGWVGEALGMNTGLLLIPAVMVLLLIFILVNSRRTGQV